MTAILISRFLINLQEANHGTVNVDSDGPTYISTLSQDSLLSFAAAPGPTGSSVESSTEHVRDRMLENGEEGVLNDMGDDILGIETPSLRVEV